MQKQIMLPEFLNFVRPSEHSKFSPSSADRWLISGCPFSINFCEPIPNETSVYSEEGTVAHSVCEATFYEQTFDIPFPDELKLQMSNWAHEEMWQHAQGWCEVLRYWMKNKEQLGDIKHFWVEKGIPVFPNESCFGTADACIIGTKGAAILDFKYGKGKNVDASSKQLMVYASGIARYLVQPVPSDYKVHCVVYQPRTNSSPKEISYTIPELNFFLGEIWKSIQESKRTDTKPIEGNHCYWCPARRTKDPLLKCPAIKEKAENLVKEDFKGFLQDMNAPIKKLTDPNPKRDAAIVKIMTLFPLMKQIVEDCTEEFKMRLEKGESIEHVRLIDVEGRRELRGTDDEIKEMIKNNFPYITPTKVVPAVEKLKTLTELKKDMGKEDKQKLDSLCVRKITKKVDIMDGTMRAILGDMAAYGAMINNNTEE